MDTDFFLDSIQWIFVILETLSLIVFVYYICEYCKSQGSPRRGKRKIRDSYTISCFVFIILTLTTRIALKLFLLILKAIREDYRSHNKQKDPDWYLDNVKEINCEANISSYLPTSMFSIAIFINSMRWLHLIRINIRAKQMQKEQLQQYLDYQSCIDNHEMTYYRSEDMQKRTSVNRLSKKIEFQQDPSTSRTLQPKGFVCTKVHYFLVITLVSSVICLLTGLKLYYECEQMKNLYYTVLEYVYVLSLLILSVFTIVVFLYSARFFPRTYLEEHENKCGANYQNLSLKRSPNFQKLKAQETPDVSTVNDQCSQEQPQVIRQIRSLKVFFWSFAAIVFVKYLTHLLYDVILYLHQNDVLVLKYIFTISFYGTEIAIVLLLCKSISETGKVEKQYLKQQQMNTVHDTPGFSTKERMKNPGLFNSMPSMASSSDRIKAGSPTEKSRNQLLKEQTFTAFDQAASSLRRNRGFMRQGHATSSIARRQLDPYRTVSGGGPSSGLLEDNQLERNVVSDNLSQSNSEKPEFQSLKNLEQKLK